MVKLRGLRFIQSELGYSFVDKIIYKIHSELKKHFKYSQVIQYKWHSFVVINNSLEDNGSLEKIEAYVNNLIQSLAPINRVNLKLQCLSTRPIVSNISDGTFFDEILSKMDFLLDKNHSNRESHILFDDELVNSHARKLSIESKLKWALENKSIYLNLQPQYDCSGNIYGFESLARWYDHELGNISPLEFIPLYEFSHLNNNW